MATLVQLIVTVPILISITVSSHVYKVVGSSLDIPLDIQKTAKLTELKWMFNSMYMLKYKKQAESIEGFSAYKERVEFSNTTFTLTLKNLTKNDNGRYTVKGDDAQGEYMVTEYTLTVLDPVQAPNLTYSCPQQSNGTFTVSCESQGLLVSTNCSNEICEVYNVTSATLTLFLHINATRVICTASNKAVTQQTTLEMNVCFSEGSYSHAWFYYLAWLGPVLCGVVILIALFLVYEMVHNKNKTASLKFDYTVNTLKNKDKSPAVFRLLEQPDHPSTVYSTVHELAQPPNSGKNSQNTPYPEVNTGQNKDESPTALRTLAEPDPPSTVYSTVHKSAQPPSGEKNSKNTPNPELNTGQKQVSLEAPVSLPVTIYSSVRCSKSTTIYATVMKTRNSTHDT